eukprot:COSAG01_NODE_1050_length_11922_cov_8.014632_1_plen_310_part_00
MNKRLHTVQAARRSRSHIAAAASHTRLMSATERDLPPHDIDDDGYWVIPPPFVDGEPIWVDCRINVFRISDVDTVSLKANQHTIIIMYWTDPRMIGWKDQWGIPAHLWGPKLELDNGAEATTEQTEFLVADAERGRMKRGWRYRGTIYNDMDLHDFPFDMDAIDIRFLTVSSWETFDGSRGGDMAKGKSYNVRKVQHADEGEWLMLGWSGEINEFKTLGISDQIYIEEVGPQGDYGVQINISIHVSRRFQFYWWKVLVPLWICTVMSFTTFWFKIDAFSDRISSGSTWFLATFAMLYVTGENLPKTDFL